MQGWSWAAKTPAEQVNALNYFKVDGLSKEGEGHVVLRQRMSIVMYLQRQNEVIVATCIC